MTLAVYQSSVLYIGGRGALRDFGPSGCEGDYPLHGYFPCFSGTQTAKKIANNKKKKTPPAETRFDTKFLNSLRLYQLEFVALV